MRSTIKVLSTNYVLESKGRDYNLNTEHAFFMEILEYQKMAQLEGSLWWYRALHEWVLSKLGPAADLTGKVVLDSGCGTGGLFRVLDRKYKNVNFLGLDLNSIALNLTREKAKAQLIQGSVNQIPIASGTVDFVLSIDVLYHNEVNEHSALLEFYRCLKAGGRVLVHVPAYQWLYSYHDRQVHTRTRYSVSQLRRAMNQAGFVDIITGYRLALLLPLLIAKRMLSRQTQSDVDAIPNVLDRVFYEIARLERRLTDKGLAIPFGSSVWAIARKT